MARIDEHNACPGCPQPVRALFYRAQQVVDVRDDPELLKGYLEYLAAAVRAFAPFVEAHHANQDHVVSPELASAREPVLAA